MRVRVRMRVRLFEIPDWLEATYDPSEYHSFARDVNVARLTVKRRILRKHDLVPEVERELGALGPDFEVVRHTATHVVFCLPFSECRTFVDVAYLRRLPQVRAEVADRLRAHFAACVRDKWAGVLVVSEDNLQSRLISSLQGREYRLTAAVHFAERKGARATLDLLDLADRVWSLRT